MGSFTGHSQRVREAMRNAPTKVSLAADQEKFWRDQLRPGSDASRLYGYKRYRDDMKAKRAHEWAMELEKLKQAGQNTRTAMSARGQLDVAARNQTGATKRTSMDLGFKREDLGFRRDKEDFNQTMGLKRFQEEKNQFGKNFGLKRDQFNYLKDTDARNFGETKRKNRLNEYRALSGIGDGEFGMTGSDVSPGTFSQRANQFNAYTGSPSPDFSLGNGFTNEQLDWLNKNQADATTQTQSKPTLQDLSRGRKPLTRQYQPGTPGAPYGMPPMRPLEQKGPGGAFNRNKPFTVSEATKKLKRKDQQWSSNYGRNY